MRSGPIVFAEAQRPPPSQQRAESLWAVVFVALATLVAVGTNGFIFGSGNNQGILPLQDSLLDPLFLRDDYLVNEQRAFNIRSVFTYLLTYAEVVSGASRASVYLAFYGLTTMALVHASFLLLSRFIAVRGGLYFAALVAFAYGWDSSLGSSEILSAALVPASFAIPLSLYALYFHLGEKHKSAALCLTASVVLHVLIGILSALVIFGAAGLRLLVSSLRERRFWAVVTSPRHRNFWIGSVLLLVLTAPVWFPLVIVSSTGASAADDQMIGFIIGAFRNPHHYIPSHWKAEQWLRYFLPQLAAFAALYLGTRAGRTAALLEAFQVRTIWAPLVALFATLHLLYLAGFLFVEVWPVTPVIKLQLYRISILGVVLIKLILISLLLSVIAHFAKRPALRSAVCAVVAGVALWGAQQSFSYSDRTIKAKARPLYQWIANHTPQEALFVTPIDMGDFRYSARRAMVVSHKSFMFKDHQVMEWYARVQSLCGFKPPSCRGNRCRRFCAKKYNKYKLGDFETLKALYPEADYFVTRRPVAGAQLVYKDRKHFVYAYAQAGIEDAAPP